MAVEVVSSCLLCGHSGKVLLVQSDDPSLHSFCLVQCTRCKLIYLSPRVEKNKTFDFYPEDYHPYSKAIEDNSSWVTRLSQYYDQYKRCVTVERLVPQKGRILDVGCSTGLFLNSMRSRGWQAYGVEPSNYAAQYAKSRFGLDVHNGFLEDAEFEENFFDVVTFWDVLEHVYNPDVTLQVVRRILKPGALLLVNLPNPESWERTWFGRYWLGWDIPRHTYIFSRETLAKLLYRTGLNYEGVSSFTGRHNAMLMSLQALLKGKGYQESAQRILLALVRSLPARLITFPFFELATRCNKSSFMAVYARKPR